MSPTTEQVAELLEALITQPSPSGEEGKAAELLVEHLTAWGLDAWTDEIGNVHACRGPREAARVVLLGHLDTVPGQVPVRWDGDVLWGRGAVDAKGPLVAHALALASLPETAASGIRLVAAVGEETDSRGALHLVETLDAPEAVVIAEPNGLSTVGLGYKGRIRARLAARTEPAHPGAPQPTASELLIQAIEQLTAWSANPTRDPGFEETSVRVMDVASHRTADLDEATATLDIRLPGDVPAADELETILADGVRLAIEEAIPAVTASPRSRLATALRGALIQRGHEPRMARKTGSSDWNVVGPAWGCRAVAYGPGDASLDHTPHERIGLGDVVEAAEVLVNALQRMGA